MLPPVRLAKAGLLTSRLAFGTSRLHYLRPNDRQRLLAVAGELGFVHFDVAPVYGDGLAEIELGRFIARGRDRFLIATKYGIPADPVVQRWGSYVPLRTIRGAARKAGLWSQRLPLLTARGLRESAENSLRRLKADRIDILLLHEPSLERVENPWDILEELNHLKQRGLIRTFGVGGAWSGIRPLLEAEPGLGEVVQTAESEWPEAFPPEITYRAINTSPQSYLRAGMSTDLAMERLRAALARRLNGVIIVSSTRMPHLRALVEMARERTL
jgi:aryl-alcohol dehydrogenase-like predicted oxidoreductase